MNNVTYAISKRYEGTFDEAIADMTKALGKEGFGILTQIDVQATLKKKLDVDYPAYQILGACNPPNAYKALLAEREMGLLLPCNVIVYQEKDKVFISVMKPTAVLTLSSNPQIVEVAKGVEAKLVKALNNAVESLKE